MKNIGIITHNFPLNKNDRQNAGIFVNDIAQELSNKNKVSIMCPSEGDRKDKIGKLRILNFPIIGGRKLGDLKIANPLDILRFVAFFAAGIAFTPKFIKKNKIEINIAMWAFPSGVFAYVAKKIYGISYMVWCLGSDIYIYGNKPILKTVIKLNIRSQLNCRNV